MLEGVKILCVWWELAFPWLQLVCWQTGCTGTMIHQKKMDLLKPSCYICGTDGSRTVAYTIDYKCNKCGHTCAGTDAEMLHSLPSYCSNQFPVEATCSKPNTRGQGRLQLGRPMTRQFAILGVSHVSSETYAQHCREQLHMVYEDCVGDFYSQFAPGEAVGLDYPPFLEWSLQSPTPSQKNVLDTYTNSFYSTLTDTGISAHERCTREIASVGTQGVFSYDHTHQIMANYSGPTGRMGKAFFTAMVGTGEVCCAVMVPDTSMASAAHAVEQMARRPNFQPKAFWSDTYPASKEFVEAMFGKEVKGHHGLFHTLQNVLETLKPDHRHHRTACRELSNCFTYDDPDDVNLVLKDLKHLNFVTRPTSQHGTTLGPMHPKG